MILSRWHVDWHLSDLLNRSIKCSKNNSKKFILVLGLNLLPMQCITLALYKLN